MDFHFLSASVPFAKTITPDSVIPYPHIGIVSSHHKTAECLEGFYGLIQDHAAQGHCLLKGLLNRPLVNEPRAGAANPETPTEWIIFDIDDSNIASTAEEFICGLPEAFHTASYIEQLSSTAYLNSNGYKAHLFFLIKPTSPRTIKNFLLNLNLTTFSPFITLGTGNLCLNYPIDVQVNGNGTPLYIAPPIFDGLDDPIPARLKLVGKGHSIPAIENIPLAVIKNLQHEKITELRHNIGLRGKQPKTTQHGAIELLDNIEAMDTPLTRTERGFVYLQLNKNNPHSYYHPVDNPTIVYNFKGEPAFLTKKGLPEYWEAVKPRQLQPLIDDPSRIPLVFRDRHRDLLYNGFKTATGFDISACKSVQRLAHFAANCNIDMPDVIPDWEIKFDPTQIEKFDLNNPHINLFIPSPPLQHCIDTNPKADALPPTTEAIIRSVTGSDELCYNHFINWLAFVLQTRTKTGTAWVLHGTEGTGKGLLYHQILNPLFGPNYCHEKTLKDLDDRFNGWLEQNIILFVDESKIGGRSKIEQIPNLLKHLITEPELSMRYMHSNPFQAKNFSNIIFATNDGDALEISSTDRRYNVCPEQLEPFKAPANIVEILAKELPQTAAYLWSFKADEKSARTALNNDAKTCMHEARLDDFAAYARYLRLGNFLPFYDLFTDNVGTDTEHNIYTNILKHWATRHQESETGEIRIKKDELKFVFRYALGKPINDITFGRLMKRAKFEFARTGSGEMKNYKHLKLTWKRGIDELRSILYK